MSDTAKAKAATVAAKIAGQAATIAAHGVPVGPLVEEVVNDLLGELLDIQDEQRPHMAFKSKSRRIRIARLPWVSQIAELVYKGGTRAK